MSDDTELCSIGTWCGQLEGHTGDCDTTILEWQVRAEAAEAERDAAHAEHAEFLRTHHFDAFAALRADRDRLREALTKLAEKWEHEAQLAAAAARAASFSDAPAHWAGAYAKASGNAEHAEALRAALAPDTAKEGT
jgi:hypothetical protein